MAEKTDRWHAIIIYRTEAGPLEVPHDFEELEDLHNLVERGPDWNAIEAITITLARTTGQTTVEEAERG